MSLTQLVNSKYSDINTDKIKYNPDAKGITFFDAYVLPVNGNSACSVLLYNTQNYALYVDFTLQLIVIATSNGDIFLYSPPCAKALVYSNGEKTTFTFGVSFDEKIPSGTQLVALPLFFPFKFLIPDVLLLFGSTPIDEISIKSPLSCSDETWNVKQIANGVFIAFKLSS